jgi:hypothetical protein
MSEIFHIKGWSRSGKKLSEILLTCRYTTAAYGRDVVNRKPPTSPNSPWFYTLRVVHNNAMLTWRVGDKSSGIIYYNNVHDFILSAINKPNK